MAKVVKSIMGGGKPKQAAPDPQIARDLAAARASETKRAASMKAKKDEEKAREKAKRKRGRRSLFAANNQGSGFDEMAEKKKTLA